MLEYRIAARHARAGIADGTGTSENSRPRKRRRTRMHSAASSENRPPRRHTQKSGTAVRNSKAASCVPTPHDPKSPPSAPNNENVQHSSRPTYKLFPRDRFRVPPRGTRDYGYLRFQNDMEVYRPWYTSDENVCLLRFIMSFCTNPVFIALGP